MGPIRAVFTFGSDVIGFWFTVAWVSLVSLWLESVWPVLIMIGVGLAIVAWARATRPPDPVRAPFAGLEDDER